MKFKKYLKKQIKDFQKYGWAGVSVKIKNRLLTSTVQFKINKLEKNKKKILIINGAAKTVSEVHRVKHLEDKLKILKIPYLTITDSFLNRFIPEKIYQFDLVYIHRCLYKKRLVDFINNFKKQNKKIIYDIDDLIFDKNQIQKISFLKTINQEFKKNFIKNTKSHLKIMKMCDLIITPTDFLSNYIKSKYKIPTQILRNHLDQKSLDMGKKIYFQQHNSNKYIIIGYFSGTKTHSKDFQLIYKTLLKILSKNPNVKLKVIGDPSLTKNFQNLEKQIITRPKIPYKKLMTLYQNTDINISPSEVNNDFCESKSELKYFFAGACGIPTIASATNAFKHAIRQGKNGYLCQNSKDWYFYLNKLIKNQKERKNLGKNAFQQVRQEYTPNFQSQQLLKILKKINFL